MKRVVVTGAAGFIGRYVCRALVQAGWHVIGIHKNGYADHPDGHAGAESIICDLASGGGLPVASFDALVHLAAESHVERSIQEPIPFVLNNVSCALRVLETARYRPVKNVVMVSTDEVFGPANDGQFYSEWDRHIPSSPYSASKSCADQLACAWWRTYGVPVVIARLMNGFGVGQHPEKMVPKTVRHLIEGKPVPVHAEYIPIKGVEGKWHAGSRTWLHAANIADAIRFILENVEPLRFPDSDRPECFNISGDKEVANDELVRMAAGILGVEPKIEYVDFHTGRPGHDRRYALRGTKIMDRGWVPPRDFEQSFRETVLEMAGKS